MPELPDVEGFRRFFRRHATGRRVRSVDAESGIVRNTSPQRLRRALAGRRFELPRRHGKWLICPADGPGLLLHFGMTGDLIWSREEPDRHRHDRLVLELDDGELRYRNQRKLGGVWLVGSDEEVQDVTGPLGPDALRISPERFVELVAGRRARIKAALMDQKAVAGLGNITADEILWRARIDPRRRITELKKRDLLRVGRATEQVLRASVRVGRVPTSSSWLASQRGRDASACPRCGSTLERLTVAGRTTYLCPSCQE